MTISLSFNEKSSVGPYNPNVVPSDISRSANNNGYASEALRHVSTCGRCCGAGKSNGSGGGGEGAITSFSNKGIRFALIGYLTSRTHIKISSSGIPLISCGVIKAISRSCFPSLVCSLCFVCEEAKADLSPNHSETIFAVEKLS